MDKDLFENDTSQSKKAKKKLKKFVDLSEKTTRLQKVVLRKFFKDNDLMTLAPYLKPHITLEIKAKIEVEQLIEVCKG